MRMAMRIIIIIAELQGHLDYAGAVPSNDRNEFIKKSQLISELAS